MPWIFSRDSNKRNKGDFPSMKPKVAFIPFVPGGRMSLPALLVVNGPRRFL